MARILLIFPPSSYRNFTPPLNLASIAASLLQDGHEVRILDLGALHPACSEEEAVEIAKDFDPLWIGLTLNVIFIRPAYDFIKKLQKAGYLVVGGGPHPSLLADECLENGCNIVVRGEGEETVRELTKKLESNEDLRSIKGISYIDKQRRIIHGQDRSLISNLDELPLPAKHLFPKEWYTLDTPDYQVFGAIFSGRGCPASCDYCYKGVFGHGCRIRTAENVFKEMKHLNKQFNVTAFEFMDDAFSADLDRVDKLCELILADPEFNPVWQCTTRLDLTTEELLKKMRLAGCFRIFYGVESGDKETLLRVNKHIDIRNAEKVLKWTRDAGIKSIVGFMWGFPWDSPSSIRASVEFIKRIASYTDEFNPLGILIPVPGTKLYQNYKDIYQLENWWLKEKYGQLYRSNAYFPYYQRRFYNDFGLLNDGFFPFPHEVKKLIEKGIHSIGRHNLFKNSNPVYASVTLMAVMLSEIIYKIHPELEQIFFNALHELKARFVKGLHG